MNATSIYQLLADAFRTAIGRVAGTAPEVTDPALRPAGEAKFGDYQCNAAMALARGLQAKPRDVAQRIVETVTPLLGARVEPLEIAGPGFINVRLRPEFLAAYLEAIEAPPARESAEVDRVGIPRETPAQRVVVEYSQPNIAKQMHVGHLRSTIIGDVFARVLAFKGHDVVRQNHIGDWGTQFGMLIRWYRERPLPSPADHADLLEAIEEDYKQANERFKTDETFAGEARRAVAELQGGDPQALGIWEQIRDLSLVAVKEIYARLGVLLRPEDVCGESFYNPQLPAIVDELRDRFGGEPAGSAAAGAGAQMAVREDAGAVVVYLYTAEGAPMFRNPEGEVLGMIIQKSDGGFLYATTDLAALRYRLRDLPFAAGRGAERIVYVTDARQKLHFEQFFAAARAAGWVRPEHRIDHVTFGTVLGEDRRPLKTRAGGTIKLRELLDEAEERALAVITQRTAEAADEAVPPAAAPDARELARRIGVAAVKYADLRNDRNTDYVFSWDKMLALSGNTAPYMLYAYARIRSIYRKAAARFGAPDVYAPGVALRLAQPAERALALRLARLPETIDAVATELLPHILCTYLYELAAEFMRFYEQCPVLEAPDEATRLSRMRMCDLTARSLRLGLGLLGIEVTERM